MKDYEISDLVQDAPAQAGENYKGIVGRFSDIVKSKYGKFATGLATGLLAAGLYTANPAKAEDLKADKFDLEVAYQDNGKKGVKLPDLSNAKELGEKGPYDELNSIEGKETVIRGYKKNNKIFALYVLPNNKIYGFGVKDLENDIEANFWDYQNDNIFEQKGEYIIETDHYR